MNESMNIIKFIMEANLWILLEWRKIVRSNKERKGKCLMCGRCCRDCRFLHKNRCLIYMLRPLRCRVSPYKPEQLKLNQYKGCGYYW